MLPAFVPRLVGERTGLSHPSCYAQSSRDCDEKRSNEHSLSKAVLTAFSDGKLVTVGERPSQDPGVIEKFTPKSLGANILCRRHNNGLSGLDKEALQIIRTLNSYYLDQVGICDDYGNEFDLFSGEVIERWMLKMVWGESESRAASPKIRGEVRRRQLADYLFRDGALPIGWGLYVTGRRAGRTVDPQHALEIRLEKRDGELRSGSLDIGGVRLTFALGARRPSDATAAIYRPGAIIFTRAGTDAHKVAALSWDNSAGIRGQAALIHFMT